MSVYTVQVTLNIDEDQISEAIATDAYKQVIDNIQKKVEKQLFKSSYYDNKTEISKIAAEIIKKEFEAEKDKIVNGSIKELSSKLIRSKLVKEKVADMFIDVDKEG